MPVPEPQLVCSRTLVPSRSPPTDVPAPVVSVQPCVTGLGATAGLPCVRAVVAGHDGVGDRKNGRVEIHPALVALPVP